MKYLIVSIIILFTLQSCHRFETKRAINNLNQLKGEWCMTDDGKKLCEKWTKLENGDYSGNGYEISNNDTTNLEELKITRSKNMLTYSALVYEQNNGEWINFELRTNVDDVMIFENKKHDFPKQIRIFFPEKNIMLVQVLGDNQEGFTNQFIRQ